MPPPSCVRERLAADAGIAAAYAASFGSAPTADAPELVLVNVAKALAAFQETIVTGRTAVRRLPRCARSGATGRPWPAIRPAAQRGLKIFVGKGRCSACHLGPNFTNGEFDDVGVPYFAEPGRVDPGRHGGIAALRASPFNLLGRYNDDPGKATASPTRHVEPQHRNWGEFRVPSLRNVAETGALHAQRQPRHARGRRAPLLRGRRRAPAWRRRRAPGAAAAALRAGGRRSGAFLETLSANPRAADRGAGLRAAIPRPPGP